MFVRLVSNSRQVAFHGREYVVRKVVVKKSQSGRKIVLKIQRFFFRIYNDLRETIQPLNQFAYTILRCRHAPGRRSSRADAPDQRCDGAGFAEIARSRARKSAGEARYTAKSRSFPA